MGARLLAGAALLTTVMGCGERGGPPVGETLFTRLPASRTGIDFENRLRDTEAFNVFTYRNYYNGGGVGIGDLDGDGLPDLYLTANQGPNRLFLSRGDFRFEDVTDVAGVGGERAWSTGVSLVDINGDGRLDLYVSNAGNLQGDDKANELFINRGPGEDGIPRFTEQAAAYGLDDEGYSTHAAFFDYDRDGDLDVYILNNSFRPVSSFGLKNIRHVRHEKGGDKLYRNDAGRFVDVSEEAGIYGSEIGFGLGVTAGDVDGDGWVDLYVSNDFFERDYLYLNNGDGTFREMLPEGMRHISLASMGADMADLNGDARPEIYVTDMLPEGDRRLKTTSTFEGWNLYQTKLRNDYHHQYMRNMLHLNLGDGRFSEVGQLAGVSATDWSWGALVADFDGDGAKDIFVSNGIYRDLTDQDFIDFFADEVERAQRTGQRDFQFLELLDRMPSTPIPNYAFANRGGAGEAADGGPGEVVTFDNVTEAWGLGTPSFSNGAAYGDLDNDGDLDLVVNNVNQEVFVYRNEADTLLGHRFLQVVLQGEAQNRFGYGAAVTVWADGRAHYLEQLPTRGFQSSVDPVLTFGLGDAESVDSLVVVWPDGRREVRRDVAAGERVALRQVDATLEIPPPPAPAQNLLADVTDRLGIDYLHVENAFVDFHREGLIPKMVSQEGPCIETGDVDGDGLDDFFIGGASGEAGRLYLASGDTYRAAAVEAFDEDAESEDVGAAFFDADGDGDLDLYVASGGNEFAPGARALADRLYLNDGRGRFKKGEGLLPRRRASSSRVAPADYDGDGDVDLFVGARLVPQRYGLDPESALLENDGTGHFTDVTERAAPGLIQAGLVTDAAWADLDGDDDLDLAVVGEWMPVVVYLNEGGGTFARSTGGEAGEAYGWWNRVVATDVDGDGDTDLALGNLGLNTKLRATPDEPMTMHVADFDRNGSLEQIVSYYKGGKSYPLPLKGELVDQLPHLKQRTLKHTDYAGKSIDEVLTPDELASAVVKKATTLASSVALNHGDGTLEMRVLPYGAQLAPVYGILPVNLDADDHQDLLLAGNFYGVRPGLGRMDASYGLYLKGDGEGGFRPVPMAESGFVVDGQVRDLRWLERGGAPPLVVAAKNDEAPQFFEVQ